MASVNAIRSAISWVVRYFFLITFCILVVFYLQRFSLEPLEFDKFDDLSILGILLLLIYGLFTVLTITEGKSRLRLFLIRMGLLFLLVTSLYATYSLPSYSRDAINGIEIILLLFYGLFMAMEKTEKSKPWIRTTLALIIILLLGLMAVLFVLLSGAYVAYNRLLNFKGLVLCVEILLLLFYLFYGPFTVMTKRARGEYWLRPFFVFAAILFLLINSLYVAFSMPILITSVDCNGTTYSITSDGQTGASDWDDYRLTIGKGLFDHKATSLGDYGYYWSSKLTCDKNTNVVRIFAYHNRLVRDFGAQSYSYDLQGDAQDSIKNIDYSLYSYAINDIQHYLVTACTSDSPDSCQFLPVPYFTSGQQNASLDVNQANQLSVSIGGKLVFTYSPPPDP